LEIPEIFNHGEKMRRDILKFGMLLHLSVILLVGAVLLFTIPAYAACVKGKHVPLTSGNQDLCDQEEKLNLERKKQELKEQRKELELRKKEAQNNSGTGAGQGNTNVILGNLLGQNGAGQQKEVTDFVISKHQFRVELAFYVIPAAYGFDEPRTPSPFMINGIAYEWYLNENLGLGFLWQRYTVEGGKDFDPITVQKTFTETVEVIGADGTKENATRTITRDVPIYFPGLVERIKYERRFIYVTGNAPLFSQKWNGIFRLGMGQALAQIEYGSIDKSNPTYQYASQPDNQDVSSSRSLYLDIGIERWTVGVKIGGSFRFISASDENKKYLEYVSLGSSEFVFYVQMNIPGLGTF
jgi:hypothetical protein